MNLGAFRAQLVVFNHRALTQNGSELRVSEVKNCRGTHTYAIAERALLSEPLLSEIDR